MRGKKSYNTFRIVVFSLLCLIIVFEVFAFINYLGFLKEESFCDLGEYLKERYANGFETALGSIVMDFISLVLCFLLPFVLQFALRIPVSTYIYIAYALNVTIGITYLIYAGSTHTLAAYSSNDYETTTIRTTYDLSSGEEISRQIKTPQDKADTANFWYSLLLLALIIAFPYVAIPGFLFVIIQTTKFSKEKWYLVLLMTVLTLALTISAGYLLALIV